jgi:cobalt-zinc-cadmium efflux system outer membrane protein
MSLVRTAQLCAIVYFVSGCQSTSLRFASSPCRTERPVAAEVAPAPITQSPVTTVAFEETTPPLSGQSASRSDGAPELSLARLIEEVQSRNPSLQAMVAAWQAAAQRYPQAVSLEDPMFMAMTAPASIGSPDVETAYALQGSQKFPWFGKRAARGRQAQAEASAAYFDVEDSRLRLAEATQSAFFDYYLASRQLELNRQNVEVMRRFRSTAEAKYRANQVTQQDQLQADVDLADLERQSIEYERMQKVAVARINTLLHEDPAGPLPPAPRQLDPPHSQFDLVALQAGAESQRPDLAALAAKIRAEQAAVTLACKDYYPDADVFGRYDTFWQPADTQGDLRGQVGVTVNVPVYRGKLNAAVREAMFRVSQRQAEYEQRRLDVHYEVANAFALVEESERTLAVYSERLIPAALQNTNAASSNYDVGKISFLELATAQKQTIALRQKQQEALAMYYIRLAELNRVVGGSIHTNGPDEEQLPRVP